MPIEAKYRTGELVLPGDRVAISGEFGFVECVVTEAHPEWEVYWKDIGSGMMLSTPSCGRVFVAFDDDDLCFISRG